MLQGKWLFLPNGFGLRHGPMFFSPKPEPEKEFHFKFFSKTIFCFEVKEPTLIGLLLHVECADISVAFSVRSTNRHPGSWTISTVASLGLGQNTCSEKSKIEKKNLLSGKRGKKDSMAMDKLTSESGENDQGESYKASHGKKVKFFDRMNFPSHLFLLKYISEST
jgi:hypothetical protein